jgi:hypothetical protein
MYGLDAIIDSYKSKVDSKLYGNSDPNNYAYNVFRNCILRAMSVFLVKDLPGIMSYSIDEMRGLLFNRMRTVLYEGNTGYLFKPKFIRNMFLSLNTNRNDISSIRLYTGRYSNNEITTSEVLLNDTYLSAEERYIGRIFSELNAMGSMKKYVDKCGYGTKILPERYRSLETSGLTRYPNVLSFINKKFQN